MKQLLLSLVIVVLAVLANWQQNATAPARQQAMTVEASVLAPQEERHAEATLTDATSLYRICSPRTQRVVPNNGSKTERPFSTAGLHKRKVVKSFHFRHDGRRRTETSPFCPTASRDYYVIALRHIIR